MSPIRPATAKRLPRFRTSLSVPVDSGSEVRSSYPSNSAAGMVTRTRLLTLSLRGAVRLVFLRRALLEVRGAVQAQVVVCHPPRGPTPYRFLADPLAVEQLVRDPGRGHHLGRVVADHAGDPVVHHLGNGAPSGSQHGHAAQHRLD